MGSGAALQIDHLWASMIIMKVSKFTVIFRQNWTEEYFEHIIIISADVGFGLMTVIPKMYNAVLKQASTF